jgi:hypothetical protein
LDHQGLGVAGPCAQLGDVTRGCGTGYTYRSPGASSGKVGSCVYAI